MEWFVKAFIKASLAWLVGAVVLGVAMAVHPAWTIYRPVHAHMNLLGFVTMMIFGIGYHVIPRVSGSPLHSPRLAAWNWWISNAGLIAFAIGFAMQVSGSSGAAETTLLVGGGVLAAIGAVSFAYNTWRTVDGSRRPRLAIDARATPRTGARKSLPVAMS